MASRGIECCGAHPARADREEQSDSGLARALPIASFALLLRAVQYARDTERFGWDFAVTLDELRREGLSDCDLRWLIYKGYLQHARETSVSHGVERSFDHTPTVRFSPRSVFALTVEGIELSRLLLQSDNRFAAPRLERCTDSHAASEIPCWDCQRRELRVGRVVVKKFSVPAFNQETILTAFQEEAWPVHLDDPLPPVPEIDPKRRLHSSIQCLNRNQHARLLNFHGDGTGRGLSWELFSLPGAAV